MSAALHAQYADALYKVAEALGYSFSTQLSPTAVLNDHLLPRIAALKSQQGLPELCQALGWQGGTIHGVIAEIRRLKTIETHGKP